MGNASHGGVGAGPLHDHVSADPRSQTVVVVLAAGSARRFGTVKQLAEIDGVPMITRVVGTALDAGVNDVVVVLGAEADRIDETLRSDLSSAQSSRVHRVDNPRHGEGQATSLVAGLEAAMATGASVAVILLADQPDVTTNAVQTVAAAVNADRIAARASYTDGVGHPVAFHRSAWPKIAAEVAGDAGARHLLKDLEVLDVKVGGRRPVDVDVQDDLGCVGSRAPIAASEGCRGDQPGTDANFSS